MTSNFTSLWRSLKTRVTLFSLVIFLVVIWSLAYFTSRMLRDDLQRLLGDQLLSTASIVAADINQELNFRLRSLEKITEDIGPAIFNDPAALQALLENRPLLMPLFNGGCYVTSIDGTATAAIPLSVNRTGLNYIERDHIVGALKEGKPTVSVPVIGKSLHTPVVSMSVPIRDIQGRIIGALTGVIDLGKPNFLDRIADNSYGKTGGYLLVSPKRRLFVTGTDKSRIIKPAPAPGTNPLFDRYVQGYEGSGVVSDTRGVEVLSAAKQIPAAGWFIVVRVPSKEAFAPIRTMQKSMMLAAAVLSILAGGLIWFMLRRQLSPILEAVNELSILSESNLPVTPLPITKEDEVGQLIGAFNRLIEILALREANLLESEQHHRSILKTAMDGIWLADKDGRLQEVNQAYCRMSGYSEQELLTMSIPDLEVVEMAANTSLHIQRFVSQSEDSHGDRFESRLRRKDGCIIDVEISMQYRSAKSGQLIAFIRDISEQKKREAAHQQTGHLLQLASTHSDLHDCMSALTASLQSWSGCEAVGIRLRDGDNFPYFETHGFPSTFVHAENQLCAFGPDGEILRDVYGNPELDCMCGNILSGRFDPDKPFFTARGSFWTNNTTTLLASTTEADRWALTRNRCYYEGYESLALVPMHAGDRIIGLIQLNDHRQDRFTPALISIFEGMAENIALTLVRRQVEEDLHESENHIRTLVNTIPDLIWLKDPDGVYLSCNEPFERLYGSKEADIIGKTDYDFVDKEQADLFRDHDRAAMLADKPSSNEEWVTFADDGHRILIYTIKMPMYDSAGKLIGVLGVGRDVTDLKKAEEAIIESESRLRYALEGTNDGLWDVLLHSGKTYLSPRGWEILGYRGDEIKDAMEVWSDLVHPDDLQITQERLQAHLEGRAAIFEVEQRLRTKSGDWKWIHTRGKVVERGLDGTPLRITGMHSDINEKKKLESQLHQAQKMESVGSLAGGVAHDFNNKLSVILGHAYLALSESIPNQVHESLEEIRKAAEQSADLTRQLLAFARKQTIAPKVLDLNVTVTGMIKMLNRLIGEDVSLTWQSAADLWPLKFDPSQIDQILANLCVNARDAMTDGGKITIETENKTIDENYFAEHGDALPGDYVQLAVSDNGCGMDKKTLARIFEPFFTTKETGKGTSLGLATVFGIVKQNNGFINVNSEPGLGTKFMIYLPRYTGTSEKSQKEGVTMTAPRGMETILIVEDELAILNMAATILEKQGYSVLKAGTPAEAIHLVKGHIGEIRLLVTDVIMPGMNGKDLAVNLKSLNPQLKCLFMSGYTADTISQHGVLDEGVSFIQKPFSLHDLARKVREILDNN